MDAATLAHLTRVIDQRDKAVLAARTNLRDLLKAHQQIEQLKQRIRQLEDNA